MFNREQLKRIEDRQSKQDVKLDRILRALRHIIEEWEEFEDEPQDAISATIEISKGDTMFTKATFKEFDVNGKQVAASGPIAFASDNAAVVIDSSQQTLDADGLSVNCPLTEVPQSTAQAANVTGVDPASANKVAAGAVDNVPAATGGGGAATSATLTLS